MTSPILAKILELKNKEYCVPHGVIGSSLKNYQIVKDTNMNKHFVSAEIHFENLDKGSYPGEHAHRRNRVFNSSHNDTIGQIIGKELGGEGIIQNCFPLNSTVDYSLWKADEQQIYEFIKQNDNRYATVMYGLECPYTDNEFGLRPRKIYYHFSMHHNGQVVGEPIEGIVDNIFQRDIQYDPDKYQHTCKTCECRIPQCKCQVKPPPRCCENLNCPHSERK